MSYLQQVLVASFLCTEQLRFCKQAVLSIIKITFVPRHLTCRTAVVQHSPDCTSHMYVCVLNGTLFEELETVWSN
jgi:hypothetical protein